MLVDLLLNKIYYPSPELPVFEFTIALKFINSIKFLSLEINYRTFSAFREISA